MTGNLNTAALPQEVFPAHRVDAWLNGRFPDRRIGRVLLVNPPDGTRELFQFDKARRRRYTNYPPYGLGILARHLLNIGVECRILNLNHEILKTSHATVNAEGFDFDGIWKDALEREIADFAPDLIGVTCMFTMTHPSLKRVCGYAAAFDIPIAIGGVHVSNDVERVLDDIPEADMAFLRESDVALQLFIRAVNRDADIGELGQIILADGSERIHLLDDRQPDAGEMDVIPTGDLMDVGNLSRYGVIGNFHGFRPKEIKFTTALSNRGCRAQCTFCSVRNFNGKAVRQRAVASVLDELEQLRDDFGIGHIVWLDDDLLKDERRAIELFDGMAARNLGLTWDATNGVIARSCTDEVVDAMVASGCIALNIGMESGNPEILRKVRKPGTTDTFLTAAEVFKRHPQIHTRVFIMIGFPGETLAQIQDTINVCQRMDLDWFSITPLQPLPNTAIYDEMLAEGLIEEVGSTEVRFQAGAFGKQDDIELGLRMASTGFAEAFRAIPMDVVPTRQQIDDIWFYMNYHLNFHRLFTEERPMKMEQQLRHLKALSDVLSPDHCFALYFRAYLQHKLGHGMEASVIDRLDNKMRESEYWRERMQAFGLAVEDLTTLNFRNKHIPRILPGELPKDDGL